ncbi:type I DNA topoisomerase [Mycoplasmopsis gallopavonis]|uniref:DNA topoisomerase 1 n=1 Tax=Mycoplasmopsis gallopavonis TaxID=76629 RepID=A0A449AZV6_9BACT|nr:type I DNA topoisomerase [Mycoplasmopsis gallopavonis]RIV16431.1 type I DNA topoisomerase [Mycoplasmopsis gallopavonis]VEU73043.1 DNA topoisomerase 1 [Mycoplasmopsis gallopavonis]
MNKLVIVESPNKVATIQKYLGSDYNVVASIGHILKMKTSGQYGLGIDFETWEPEYSLDSSKRNVVKEIKNALKDVEHVYIATDPDREGEAIASHLVKYFKLEKIYSRIKYNEITKDAILKSIEKAGELDYSLIDAQKARRMLDRIIGFRLSNLMRGKLKNAPGTASAGRVQSIALKLVVDRENEILSFVPEKYSKLHAKLANNPILAYYHNAQNDADRKEWIYQNELEIIKKDFANAPKKLLVTDVKTTTRTVAAVLPFKQAVLYRKSQFNSQATQFAAQKLYEGYGDGGLISYPRTDSTRLSQTFVDQAQNFILNKWGQEYVASEIKGFSGDQDAHEAIRPTNVALDPESAKVQYPEMSDVEYKIYKLIYETTLQALIKQPIREVKSYTYQALEKYNFKNSYSRVKFDGYYVVTGKQVDDLDPDYKTGQEVSVEEFVFEDHETKPAPRYNDGSLIEALDNIKVGRPSTFATTVKIIRERNYVKRVKGQLIPTEFGNIVLKNLIIAFPNIINEDYTAKVETELDQISEAEIKKDVVMLDFWNRFIEEYNLAQDKIEPYTFALHELEEPCPEDQGVLLVRNNKKGQEFVGCKNFPKCKFTRSLTEEEKAKLSNKEEVEDETQE